MLDTIRELATGQITMLIVSLDMSFVREVSHRVAFMADGRVQEISAPEVIFGRSKVKRTQDFLTRTLPWLPPPTSVDAS